MDTEYDRKIKIVYNILENHQTYQQRTEAPTINAQKRIRTRISIYL